VTSLLTKLEIDLKYADSFHKHQVSVADLPLLSEKDLVDIIDAIGPRRRLQKHIEEMQQQKARASISGSFGSFNLPQGVSPTGSALSPGIVGTMSPGPSSYFPSPIMTHGGMVQPSGYPNSAPVYPPYVPASGPLGGYAAHGMPGHTPSLPVIHSQPHLSIPPSTGPPGSVHGGSTPSGGSPL